jgi:hypothetical protein
MVKYNPGPISQNCLKAASNISMTVHMTSLAVDDNFFKPEQYHPNRTILILYFQQLCDFYTAFLSIPAGNNKDKFLHDTAHTFLLFLYSAGRTSNILLKDLNTTIIQKKNKQDLTTEENQKDAEDTNTIIQNKQDLASEETRTNIEDGHVKNSSYPSHQSYASSTAIQHNQSFF